LGAIFRAWQYIENVNGDNAGGASAGGEAGWELWRQDDNGNRFLVAVHAVRAEAEAQLAALESGVAHKQFYWITAAVGRPPLA
jgi:hypothetical protein